MKAVGVSRDMKVLEGLEKFRYLNTNQIAELYFANIKDPKQRTKKASERMKKMFDRGYIQRFRFPSEPYIFTTKGSKFSSKIQHFMLIADCWIMLNKIRPAGSVLNCEVKFPQGDLITDLVIEYKNNFRNEHKIYWLEVENNSSGDILEKVKKYSLLQWTMRREKQAEGHLCVVAVKDSTMRQLEAYKGEVTLKAYRYQELEQEWKW